MMPEKFQVIQRCKRLMKWERQFNMKRIRLRLIA